MSTNPDINTEALDSVGKIDAEKSVLDFQKLRQLSKEVERSSVNQKTAADAENLLLAYQDPNLFSKDPTTIVPKKKTKWVSPRSPEKTEPEAKFRKINGSVSDAISDSNAENSKIYGKDILQTPDDKSNLTRGLVEHLKKINNGKAIYSPDDEIAVWVNNSKPCLKFRRHNETKIVIIRP
ncbi:MAG: hypothetical protein WCV72_02300 [Patescibacteria group bacterium]